MKTAAAVKHKNTQYLLFQSAQCVAYFTAVLTEEFLRKRCTQWRKFSTNILQQW